MGTFYRGLPDRGALLDELQRRGYDLLLATLRGSGGWPRRCRRDRGLSVTMPDHGRPVGGDAASRCGALTDDEAVEDKARDRRGMDEFLAEGRADGSVHEDVRQLDVIVGTFVAMPLPPRCRLVGDRAAASFDVFIRGLRP